MSKRFHAGSTKEGRKTIPVTHLKMNTWPRCCLFINFSLAAFSSGRKLNNKVKIVTGSQLLTWAYNREERPLILFLMYLKDLHLLQSDLLTLPVIFGQVNGLQNQSRVCGTGRISGSQIGITKYFQTQDEGYLCRWTGRHRCCPLLPLGPPPIYWICSEHPLWQGGGALPEAARFPKTTISAFNCNAIV